MAGARVTVRFRRASHLVLYWRADRLILHNYASGRRVQAAPALCTLLDYCSQWRTAGQIAGALHLKPSAVTTLLRRLVQGLLLERSDRPKDPRVQAMALLDSWNPEAGLFHTATRDVRFWSAGEAVRQARLQASRSRMPPPVKRYRGAPTIALPRSVAGSFPDLLRSRRTWRRFSSKPVSLEELGTLLSLATGVQQWVDARPKPLALKTSPSGGARHPIECYVVAQRVRGLRAGVYHYASDTHVLERLRGPVSPGRLRRYYPSSGYFAKAPVHVFLTAVFARQVWRYPYARAYRAALAEAGHVCQTFCLTATWLGLAPFCLMGLADTSIEQDLGIDGITESVLYAAGAGQRPRGTRWAPLVRGTLKARINRKL